MRVRRRVTDAVGLLGLVLLASGAARAHEVPASRFTAPIPLSFLLAGAGLTVAVTALLLAVTVEEAERPERFARVAVVGPSAGRWLQWVARLGFLALVLLAVWRGLAGPQIRAENFATVFVWPVWFKGVALLAILFGSPWAALSPWRTLYLGLSRLEGEPLQVFGDYPARLGTWPAFGFFVLGVGVVENLTLVPRAPRATAALVAGYTAVMVVGAVAFGEEWFRRADALDVLYRLFGRVAPFAVARADRGGYTLTIRPPWRDCVRPVDDASTAAFVVAAVYTVSFDGFTNTRAFQSVLFAVHGWTGLPVPSLGIVLYAAGLGGFLVGFAAVVALTRTLTDTDSGSELASAVAAFAPTVVPIAAAYEVAHYYPFVLRNLGLLVGVVGEWLTGVYTPVSPLWWLSLPAFWASQVVLIVAGHVVAVVAAHYVVLDRYPAARRIHAHAPMTLLMVGYTVLSLWVISRPVVS